VGTARIVAGVAGRRFSAHHERPTTQQHNTRGMASCKTVVYNAVYLWYTDGEVIKMSSNTTYNIRIDSRIKKEADELYKSMGMTLSAAVNLFLTQSVIQRRLPIDDVIAEPLGEPPAENEYTAFESWEEAKEWLNA
jgi:DNA-damage-inducible protein J